MKSAISFLFLLAFSGYAFGQKTFEYFVISGVVLTFDSLPAQDVLLETEIGPIPTDHNGRFRMELSDLPTAITAKYRGYPDNDFYIDAPKPGFDSVNVVLVLEPNIHGLDEVVVTNERVRWVYPDKDLHMIDCVILPEGFAYCGAKNHKYYFRVIDDAGEVVAELPIREHPERLFQDCEGELHVCYYDSVYQVRWSPGHAEVFNVVSKGYFSRVFEPCSANFPSFKVMGFAGTIEWDYGVMFYFGEERLTQLHRLYQATSRKYLIRLEEYKTYLERGGKSRKDRNDNDVLDLQKHEWAAHELQIIEERRQPQKKQESVALNVRDSLKIFDFKNDSVVVYTPDMKFVRRFPLSIHVNKHFDGRVFTDLSKQRLFFVFVYDGMVRLMEVDPDNGKIIGETKLVDHIYPMHLQVRGDFVYYLYQNHLDRSITFLFKQRLNDPRKP